MPTSALRPSPAGLTVLCLLEAAPLHPYGMQRLIRAWGKDEVVNVGQRANLYKTIKRLHEAGLIAVRQTERDGQYPERTVYELTDEGHATGQRWLAEMLATPRNEYPEFPGVLSFAMALGPEQLHGALDQRLHALQTQAARLDEQLAQARDLPRIVLIESEYQHAVLHAEIDWLTALLEDLAAGELTWDHDQLEPQAIASVDQADSAHRS
jgi:DNA-binding PadR family transcriptional regulator